MGMSHELLDVLLHVGDSADMRRDRCAIAGGIRVIAPEAVYLRLRHIRMLCPRDDRDLLLRVHVAERSVSRRRLLRDHHARVPNHRGHGSAGVHMVDCTRHLRQAFKEALRLPCHSVHRHGARGPGIAPRRPPAPVALLHRAPGVPVFHRAVHPVYLSPHQGREVPGPPGQVQEVFNFSSSFGSGHRCRGFLQHPHRAAQPDSQLAAALPFRAQLLREHLCSLLCRPAHRSRLQRAFNPHERGPGENRGQRSGTPCGRTDAVFP